MCLGKVAISIAGGRFEFGCWDSEIRADVYPSLGKGISIAVDEVTGVSRLSDLQTGSMSW